MRGFNIGPNKTAPTLLITTAVLLLGAAGCAVLILNSSGSPRTPLMIVGGVTVTCLVVAWVLRDRRSGDVHLSLAMFRRKPKKKVVPYSLMKQGTGEGSGYGTNRPVSVEEVKELKEGISTWVPREGGNGSGKQGTTTESEVVSPWYRHGGEGNKSGETKGNWVK